MKRYRIFIFDFDCRAHSLEPPQEGWDENVKKLHEENRIRAIEGMKQQFGEWELEQKIKNFIDLKFKPFSVLAFHNKFLEQARNAFVIGSYYPALTSACALGERILNHLIISLRNHYREKLEYKKVHRKDSFDYWPLAIDTLESWSILLPQSAAKFRELNERRNRAIHFNPETDHNERILALEAIHLLQEIVSSQFSAFGTQPWLFVVPGECYIRAEWENHPFVQLVYLPSCAKVGPKHVIESMYPQIVVNDKFDYEDRTITDEEYSALRTKQN